MDSFNANNDVATASTVAAGSSSGSSNSPSAKILLRFSDAATSTLSIDPKFLRDDSKYTVNDLKALIFEWSQGPSSGVFLERNGFTLRIAGKRKQRILSDGSEPLASLGLKDMATMYVDISKMSVVDDNIFDNDESDDEENGGDEASSKHQLKRRKSSQSESAQREPISIAYDNSGNAKDLAGIIINNGACMKVDEMGFHRLGEFQLNMFTTAARLDALKSGKIRITETNDDVEKTSFVVNFESHKKSYCDRIQKTMGMEIIESVALEILGRISTSRRRNKDGLRKIFSLEELAGRAPWLFWSLARIYENNYLLCDMALEELLKKID